MSRLTDASGSYGVINYEYDAVGNRKSREQNNRLEAYEYAESSNRLLNVITEGEQGELHERVLGYDAVGNIVNDSASAATKALTFGHNNRLEQVKLSGSATVVAGYEYNAKGQSVIKQVDGKVIHFHYDTDNRLIAETTATGAPIREYIYAVNQRIAMVDYQSNTNGDLFFMVNDHLGTPQLLVDAAQQVVWSVNQSPFGEVTVNGNVEQPLRFPGQYADSETGYSYNYFRDYDPTLGRYIESDPIGLEAGVNTFGYVDGNPIRSLDLHGLYKDPDWTVWWKPMAFGTAVHTHVGQLFQARSGYSYNVDYGRMFNGLRPDVLDTNGLRLWEMKPISYRTGPGRVLAVSQVTSYSKASGFSLGNSTELLGGTTMDAGMMLFDDSFYRITLYADSWLGDTGLFFYDAYKMNKQEVIDFYAAVDNDARSLSGSGAYCPVF